MTNLKLTALLCSLFFGTSVTANAQVAFNNGLATNTVGYANASLASGGYFRGMTLTAQGQSAPLTVGYEVGVAYSVNGGAWAILPNTAGVTPTLSGGNYISSSSFTGANGAVNWNATSSWTGSTLLTQYSFTPAGGTTFGNLRIAYYLDNDINGSSDDLLVVHGSTAGGDLKLYTYDNTDNFGVGTVPDFGATNMSFSGWAASTFSADLNSTTVGTFNNVAKLGTYTLAGSINGIPTNTDARFTDPRYGYRDVIIGMVYTMTPTATGAGIFNARTEGLVNTTVGLIPEPGSLMFLALGGLVTGTLMRRSRRKS
jgi:hypothetical protein